jgi:hypothetical protein
MSRRCDCGSQALQVRAVWTASVSKRRLPTPGAPRCCALTVTTTLSGRVEPERSHAWFSMIPTVLVLFEWSRDNPCSRGDRVPLDVGAGRAQADLEGSSILTGQRRLLDLLGAPELRSP